MKQEEKLIIEDTSRHQVMNEIANKENKSISGLRYFTVAGVNPFDTVEWERRDAVIMGDNNKPIFEQRYVEFPKFWSQLATNIVASRYFYGQLGSLKREQSLKQMLERVVGTITEWGKKDGYFSPVEAADAFYYELMDILLKQRAAFNSPVWFNCGVEDKPQCSACFINSVEDTMESILDLAKIEGMLFKYGSGTGTNFSPLRSSKENLSSGGLASGPVSFMRGYDSFAGAIKSGGKTRRAAKMVILNIEHPDIVEFIESKANEEKKAQALIDVGYDGSFGGEAYTSVAFQNANHSVRVTDDFMHAVETNQKWATRAVKDGRIIKTFPAVEIMEKICKASHLCGDPGLQFDTTINDWHTCSNTDRIHASNPCSEYMFLNNSACNLSSINLLKFLRETGEFDLDGFRHTVNIMITAQEIIVDRAGYPTSPIAENSKKYRPLGLGCANLGALLMSEGLPYDSSEGRRLAALITAVMTGEAYLTSSNIAARKSPFSEYEKNREPMLAVIKKHRAAIDKINPDEATKKLYSVACMIWDEAYKNGKRYGYRNAQVTVLAPTGTIGLMMDCDTLGIEPDIALIKYKNLIGGGTIKMINRTVPQSLRKLGYSSEHIAEIMEYIEQNGTIEGASGLKDEHLSCFDCAISPAAGKRSIHYMGHIRMMAEVQPFISGAISKTVNMPNETTPLDIMNAYIQAWKLGLKSIAVYRDGSKRTQPLNTSKNKEKSPPCAEKSERRRRLPPERKSITHKFSISGHEGYITVGMYDDGTPGEVFITMSKQGSIVSGLMDSFATTLSMSLQYGVPLKVLIDKFRYVRFEPSGFTSNPDIPMAKSIMDYLARWLARKFLPSEENKYQMELPVMTQKTNQLSPIVCETTPTDIETHEKFIFKQQGDAPTCTECGSIMIRSGSCYNCSNCGSTSGCS